jgi:transposase
MMGAAYSVDLRRKVVQACERGTASQAEVARLFGVSRSFVEKLLRLRRRTGALEPDRKRAGRPARIDATTCDQVQRWLQEQNDLTLAELADRLQAECGLGVSVSCVWRLMRRLHMRRKKDRPCHRTRRAACTTGTPAVPHATCPVPVQTTSLCRRVRLQHCHDQALWPSRTRHAGA